MYLPVRAMSCPLPTEVSSRPSTIGSRYTPEIVGETPCTTWRNSGRKDSAPNIAKPAARLIAEAIVNTELRNSRSGSTGSAARRADRYHRNSMTAEAANRPMITPEPHG